MCRTRIVMGFNLSVKCDVLVFRLYREDGGITFLVSEGKAKVVRFHLSLGSDLPCLELKCQDSMIFTS